MMKNLTLDEIIYINEVTIRKHGGLPGIKSQSLIEGSLSSGLATFDGEDLYSTVEDKISMISYSFIKNHGFNDGTMCCRWRFRKRRYKDVYTQAFKRNLKYLAKSKNGAHR